MSVVKPKPNYASQSKQTQITQSTNQNSKQMHVTAPSAGKRVRASRDWFGFYFCKAKAKR